MAAGLLLGTPANLAVPDQAIEFGRLTLVGDGGATLTHTGGTITSVTLGTRTVGSDHFNTSTYPIIPTSVPSDAQYVWTGCTATGSLGTSNTFTLTINTLANTYSYVDDSDITAILAISSATTAGKTFKGRAGNYSRLTITNYAWGSETTLGAHDASNKPIFDSIYANGNTSNLTIDGVEVYKDIATAFVMVEFDGTASNGKVKNCVIHSKYFDPTAVWDPTPNVVAGINTTVAVSTVTVEDCTFYQLGRGMVLRSAAGGTLNANRNTLYEIASDGIIFGGSGSGAYPNVTCNDNLIYDLYTSDPLDHQDAIQWIGAVGNTGDWTVSVNRNRCIQTSRMASGAAMQGIFMDNLDAGSYIVGTISGNFVCDNVSDALTIGQAKSVTLANNTIVRGGTPLAGPQFIIGNETTSGTHISTRNVAEVFSIAGTPTITDDVTLGVDGVTIPYSTAFLGPTFDPATPTEAMTMFSIKPSGPLDTSPATGAVKIGATLNDWSTVP